MLYFLLSVHMYMRVSEKGQSIAPALHLSRVVSIIIQNRKRDQKEHDHEEC